ncbi:hypothetical protein R4Z10_07805 [Niallia sp. XMNu-256]
MNQSHRTRVRMIKYAVIFKAIGILNEDDYQKIVRPIIHNERVYK